MKLTRVSNFLNGDFEKPLNFWLLYFPVSQFQPRSIDRLAEAPVIIVYQCKIPKNSNKKIIEIFVMI